MSFLFYQNTHIKKRRKHMTNRRTIKNERKEQDSFSAHLKNRNISPLNIERASAFTSKGSITLETAMTLPFFFLAVLCLVCLLEMMNIQTVMKSALHYAAKETAKESYVNPVVLHGKIERDIVQTIGEERLERSMIYGGSTGIHCQVKPVFPTTSIIDISVQYQIQISFFVFRIPLFSREETVRVKGWNGYEKGGFGYNDEEIVYITENGIVYHKDANCSYLDLSVHSVVASEISELRNDSGGKYYPCEACGGKYLGVGFVYITDSGNRYHTSLSCRGLKRTVYAVKLSEVYGRGGCSRCVK